MKKRTKRHFERAMGTAKKATTRASRRHKYKAASMCEDCLLGRHPRCTSAECNCVHREKDVPK